MTKIDLRDIERWQKKEDKKRVEIHPRNERKRLSCKVHGS